MENSKNKKTIIILCAIIVMVLWGSLFPFVKWGFLEFGISSNSVPDVLLFAGLRFLISGFVLTIISMAFIKKSVIVNEFKNKKTITGIVLVGLFSVILHYTCTYISLTQCDSSSIALLKQSGVLVFVCFSFLFIKDDKFSIFKVIAALLGVASIVIVNIGSLSFILSLGTILAVSSSLCTVISNIIFKKILSNVNPCFITGLTQLIGGFFLTIIGLVFGGSLEQFTTTGLFVSIYIIVATIVSYGLWYAIVQKYDLSKLFIIKMLEPLFACLVSAILPLGAIIEWNHLVAILFVGLAIIISNIKIQQKKIIKNQEEILYESNVG